MAVLTIYTNLEKSAIPEEFVEEATELFAKAISKAKQDIWICMVPSLLMGLGGDRVPCAICEVVSKGNLGEQGNAISEAICEMISSKLSIGYDKIFINFCERAPFEVSFNAFQVI